MRSLCFYFILWILNDYLENGYYFNREKKYSHDNKGKIDWKRTLKSVPIYSKGNLIYDKLVTTKMTASNDIITQIYKLCLLYSYKRIGWLFNYHIHVDVQQLKSIKEMIYIVDKELNSTFDDIKRLRFKHMLKILKGIHNENALSNKVTYGITNYYYVFEKMVDKFFQGIDDDEKKKFEPGGYWQLGDQDPVLASNLKPDTIYKKEDKTYIIDAKMYRYGYTKKISDLPKTSSMQKQITYGDYVVNNLGIDKVRNAFIIPYDKYYKHFIIALDIEKCDDLDNNLAYIGKAYVDWREDKKDHDYIYTFLIDYNYLFNHYNEKDTRYIDRITSKIEENIDKLHSTNN